MPPALLLALGGADPYRLMRRIGIAGRRSMNAVWLYPLILIAGALAGLGSADERRAARCARPIPGSPALVSFLPVLAFLRSCLCACRRPLPTVDGVRAMPWWAPLGGLIGAFAVVAGLLFVDKCRRGRLRRTDDHSEHPDVAGHRPFRLLRHAAACR